VQRFTPVIPALRRLRQEDFGLHSKTLFQKTKGSGEEKGRYAKEDIQMANKHMKICSTLSVLLGSYKLK
jgi:hypothetical protein